MSRLIAPFLALMYHRVNTLKPDPWDLCVSPEHFAQHLQVIRRLPIRTVITFDDGYADNFENATPLLEQHDMPATFFITSGAVGSPYEMWWDELDRKFLQETSPDWDWGGPDPDDGAVQYRQAFQLARNGHFEIYTERSIARPERRMMTALEVAKLAHGGLIAIGAHTMTHPVLSALDVDQQRWEVVESKRCLEEITGKPISSFAYPNGFKVDYSEDTMRIVQQAGFACAYAAWEASLNEPINRYQIPRMMVRDWDGDTFASLLRSKISP